MKKITIALAIILSIFLITGCDLETTEKTEKKATTQNQEQNSKTDENNSQSDEKKEDTKNDYLDALRKCTVMETADIYTTGIGKKSSNVFDDGKAACETMYKQLDEKDFFDAINEDWNNRQNEEIDGKPLSYYLDILGW